MINMKKELLHFSIGDSGKVTLHTSLKFRILETSYEFSAAATPLNLSLWLWSRFAQCVELVILPNMPKIALKYSFSSSFMGKNLVDAWWSCCTATHDVIELPLTSADILTARHIFTNVLWITIRTFLVHNSKSKVRRWSLYIMVAYSLSTSKVIPI